MSCRSELLSVLVEVILANEGVASPFLQHSFLQVGDIRRLSNAEELCSRCRNAAMCGAQKSCLVLCGLICWPWPESLPRALKQLRRSQTQPGNPNRMLLYAAATASTSTQGLSKRALQPVRGFINRRAPAGAARAKSRSAHAKPIHPRIRPASLLAESRAQQLQALAGPSRAAGRREPGGQQRNGLGRRMGQVRSHG